VECLRPASVGQHCVDCVAAGRRTTRRPVTISGARTDRQPIVLPILVALNVIVFVVTVVQARSVTNLQGSSLFDNWALIPLLTRNGYWWQLITAGFLHVSVIHILLNMVALWVIGRDLERVLGPLRFAIVYLLGVIGGNVAVFVFAAPNVPEAGASTGVFALMGGLLVVVYRLKVNPSQVIGLIVVNLVISVVIPGISLLGHVGGLITGLAVTFALVNVPSERRTRWQAVTVAVAVVVLLGLVLVRASQLPVLT
jgi:membrane associated rhomboid family serine protease